MEGYLPSGELYGQYINRPEAFHFIFEVEYRYSIKEDRFVSLIESGTYYPQLLEDSSQKYQTTANQVIQEFLQDQPPFDPKGISAVEEQLSLKITDADSRYNLTNIKIRSYQYPDVELYDRARSSFLDELTVLRKVELQTEQISSEIETVTSRKNGPSQTLW